MRVHGHSDHTRGDAQFTKGGAIGSTRVTIVDASIDAVRQFFGFGSELEEVVSFELGWRKLLVSHIPGHDARSIVVVDPARQAMLSTDTAYPGRLYVQDLPAWLDSLERMGAPRPQQGRHQGCGARDTDESVDRAVPAPVAATRGNGRAAPAEPSPGWHAPRIEQDRSGQARPIVNL